MRIVSWVVPAMLLAGCAGSKEPRPDPGDPQAKTQPVEYRSAFDGYRSFAERELIDWRSANEEVGRAGVKPGQGAGQATSKLAPGKPETSGAPAAHGGHGEHK